jgi:polar amino acid transport system substrate-binding protein
MKKGILFVFLITICSCVFSSSNALRVGVYDSPPFVMKDVNGECTGLAIDIWKKVADEKNIKYQFEYYNCPSGEILEKLKNDSLDVVLGSTTITSNRMKDFKFSNPFFVSSLSIAFKMQRDILLGIKKTIMSVEFLKLNFWLFVIVYIWGFIIWLVEHKKNEEFRPSKFRGIFDGFYFAWVVLTTVGFGDKKPITDFGKVLVMAWMWKSLMINAVLISGIVAITNANMENNNIDSLADLKKTKLGTITNTTGAEYLDKKDIKYISYYKEIEALEHIESGDLETFIYDTPVLKYHVTQNKLNVNLSINTYDEQLYGIVYQKSVSNDVIYDVNIGIMDYKGSEDWEKLLAKYNVN